MISLPLFLVTLFCLVSLIAVTLRYGVQLFGNDSQVFYSETLVDESQTANVSVPAVASTSLPASVATTTTVPGLQESQDLSAKRAPYAAQGRPTSSGKNTTLRWLADPEFWDTQRNPLGQRSRYAVLENVDIQAHSVHVSGLSDRERFDLSQLPQYQAFRQKPVPHYFNFYEVRDGYQETFCRVTYKGPVILVPPHLPSNVFHLHNDLILKVAWLLRWTGETPKETTLLLFKGDPREMQHACQLYDLLKEVLKSVDYPAESAFDKRACFRKLIWSPALCWGRFGYNEPFYVPHRVSFAWKSVARHWVGLAYSSLGLAEPSGKAAEIHDPWRVLWFTRKDSKRRITNFDNEVRPALGIVPHFITDVISDFAHGKAQLLHLLGRLLQADVVAGLHGAALGHALYLRPGAAIMELKTSYAFETGLFVNIAYLRELWYYAVDVRKYQHGDTVVLPVFVVNSLFRDLHERLSHHNRNMTMHDCQGSYWNRFLGRLPRNAILDKPANDYCDVDTRKADLLRARPPAVFREGSIDEVCNAVKVGSRDMLHEVQGVAVLVLRNSALGSGQITSELPRYFLPYAFASLAEVHLLQLTGDSLDETNFWTWMRSHLFVPEKSSTLAAASGKLTRAAARVCPCTDQMCQDTEVWAAFQGYWRRSFRSSLLKFMQLDNGVARNLLTQVATHPADLAVHVPCGDVKGHNHSNEFGFSGIRAFERALEDRPKGWPLHGPTVTIRLLMAPLPGAAGANGSEPSSSAVPEKAFCAHLASSLRNLLVKALRPADVVVSDSTEMLTAWAHLALAKRTLCSSLTCLWPTLAALKGYLADAEFFFSRAHLPLQGISHLVGLPVLSLTTVAREQSSVDDIIKWIASN